MQPADAGVSRPFRWDLVTPDQLGTLLDGCRAPDLWFADELTFAAAQVLARSGGGDLHFVGSSPDSMFDLLSGALSGTDHAPRLHRLAFSPWGPISREQIGPAREFLRASGITPQALARAHRPVALTDLVSQGKILGNLYRLLRDWVDDDREPWSVIRRKLHFVGITARQQQAGPDGWSWQQGAQWPTELPARAVVDVSIDARCWSYFADYQTKLTRSYHPASWTAGGSDGPQHSDAARSALAEAVALVEFGRHGATRAALARTMAAEPAYAESWLRNLVRQLT